MLKHVYTEPAEVNFSKLEERLLQVNDVIARTNFQFSRRLPSLLRKMPTLIMATGGSCASAKYLKMFLESKEILCEVIEPRDYFYKQNISSYQRLIVLSNSGKSNGMLDALRTFPGEATLITNEYVMQDEDYTWEGDRRVSLFDTIYWSNGFYLDNKEKSFISIIPTLGPNLMFLELEQLLEENKEELTKEDYIKINEKLKVLISKSRERVERLDFDFKETNLIQVSSGYDTKVSSCILESNMIETGTTSVCVHDKGSYCHGRSNLLFQNPDSPMIYLAHQMKSFDYELLHLFMKEYPNIFLFHTLDEEQNIFWKEFYLSLQMYYLSEKIATDKGIDLTMPEYNPEMVKKLYKYKGEM